MGILQPLPKPKPKKTDEPCENLRPIMLLSVLRKILTIVMLKRIWDRVCKLIPASQAAYQPGRSTSEQILTVKLLAEKAINENQYNIFLALFDMSKAFDTVNREKLFKYLEEILKPDELHIISILTNVPQIKVKVNNSYGRLFTTMIGIMQGDCLSALLFIFYLAQVLKNEREVIIEPTKLLITPKFADDITYLTDNNETYNKIQQEIPTFLQNGDLKINNTKTELYSIPKKTPPLPPPTPEQLLAKKRHKTKMVRPRLDSKL